MTWEATTDVGRFGEAVDWFRSRIPTTADRVSLLDEQQRRRAFIVAGATELAVVSAVHDELAKAIENGTPLEDFKKRVRQRLKGWEADGHQLESVFVTNVQSAYNTGRWYQLTDPEVTALRPYLMYDAVLDSRTTPICRGLDGTVKAHDDPFVLERWPPLHHRCRGSWRSLRRDEVEDGGGVTDGDPAPPPSEGFGLAPPVRGDGWQGPNRDDVPPDLFPLFEKKQLELDFVSAENAAIEQLELVRRREEDPQHWLDLEYRSRYGERVGKSVAWGRAMEHRGLSLKLTDAEAKWRDLRTRGVRLPEYLDTSPIDASRDFVRDVDPATLESVRDLVDAMRRNIGESVLVTQLRATAALLGHHASIATRKINLPKGRRAGRNAPSKAQRDQAHARAVAFYETMGDASLVHPEAGYKLEWTGSRAQWTPGKLRLRGSPDGTDLVHEWAHALDDLNPELGFRAKGFLLARTEGERLRRLNELIPGSRYKDREVALEDKFADHYVGKVYPGNVSEVTTMGAQWIATGGREQRELFESDPEHFWFTLGQLAGEKSE